MGCSLGPSNTLIVNRAKFFFDASAPGSLVDVAYVAWMPGYTMTASKVQYNYNLLKNRFGLS